MYDVIVVGGGAAGIMAAGRASQKGARVLLIEKMNRPGKKILITGKGRCNLTHDAPPSEYFKNIFPNPRFLKHAFHHFFKDDVIRILHDQGVRTTTERGNRVFPVSNRSLDVLNALWHWMNKGKPDTLIDTSVEDLIIENNTVKGVSTMSNQGRKEYFAQKVIIATGGKSYPATGSGGDGYGWAKQSGHHIVSPMPALVPLVVKEVDKARNLQGLSLKNCNAILWMNGKKITEAFGELLFTHYGLSGPVILSMSRQVLSFELHENKVEISIDLKPALDEKKLDARLLRDLDASGKKQVENIFRLWLPSKMIPVFLDELQIEGKKPGGQLSAAERRRIRILMKDMRFTITGNAGFKEAIITSGGVDTRQVDSKTMESKKISNLFFAGEILDLDGNTGGFNLQIAFSTGWLAGDAAYP
ncbi:MAG: NAD(P)/FAD-dependent oxidoreductase [Bacteroidales bacterium]